VGAIFEDYFELIFFLTNLKASIEALQGLG